MSTWILRGRGLALDRPRILGILNVTPDSFSDGGRFLSPDAAVEHGLRLFDEGADIVDVGGESTRPQGAVAVPAEEEARRVVPVIAALARARGDALISVDTVKSEVARAALDAGARIVNDVSGLRLDPGIAACCAATGAGLLLMHSRGTVSEMGTYLHATYDDVVADVERELRASLTVAEARGVGAGQIVLDPGIGFAKRGEDSVRVLAAIPRLLALGYPIAVGLSRKRFIGEITGVAEPAGRLSGTIGGNVAALALGARIFRVHDVRAHREALDVAWEILRQRRAD